MVTTDLGMACPGCGKEDSGVTGYTAADGCPPHWEAHCCGAWLDTVSLAPYKGFAFRVEGDDRQGFYADYGAAVYAATGMTVGELLDTMGEYETRHTISIVSWGGDQ